MLDVEKPLSMVRADVIKELNDKVLNSGLDLYIIEPILVDALTITRQAIAKREQADIEAYKKKLNKQKEQKEG